MKKRKLFFISFVLTLCTGYYSYAQFYMDAAAGFSRPAMQQLIGYASVESIHGISTKSVYNSFGGGFSPKINFGINIGKHFSTELACSWLESTKVAYSSTRSGPGNYKYSDTRTLDGTMFRIMPGVRFSLGENKFRLYNSIRVIIGAGGKITDQLSSLETSPSGSQREETVWKYYGGVSSGFSGALGISYTVGKMNIFCEANMICQSWAPKKGTLMKYEVNGIDQSQGLTVAWKEMEFIDSSTQANTENEPAQRLKRYWPFGSAGINIGVTYSFGKK